MNEKGEKDFDIDIAKLTAGLENTRNINRKKSGFKFKFKYLVFIIIVFAVVGFTNSISSKQDELRNDPWAKECNDINDFKYTIENRYIQIDEYIGNDKRVKLCKNYIIDDKEYTLTSLGDEVFASKNVFSVLFPNSIESLPSKTFYKSKVKYIYIPKSFTLNDEEYQFSYYLDGVEKIYYEGTKNDWALLTDYDKEMDEKVEEVYFDTKYSDLIINE